MQETLADVLIFRGVNKTYTYRVPDDMTDNHIIGKHVTIPLGYGYSQGLIIAIKINTYEKGTQKNIPEHIIELKTIKSIVKIDDKKPVINKELIDLVLWFSSYYHTTPYKAYQTIISSQKLRDIPEKQDSEHEEKKSSLFILTDEQKHAVHAILSGTGYSRFLLHGITASGKTEVYIQCSQAMLKKDKRVIMLVPEIALTPQFRRVFKERFGSKISVIHSGLTQKERSIEWNRIHQGVAKIIIGPRSAVFSPVENLGLLIIDEEHEPSYKQESHPRYLTHQIAEFRCAYNQALLVYGSATPSIDTYSQSESESDTPPPYFYSKHA
ncbi:DEAD/DEAH box helicase [Thermoproteota archaeon]